MSDYGGQRRGRGGGGGGGYRGNEGRGGGQEFQRSYIGPGGKRGRDDGPEPPKLSAQHLRVAKLLGVCDRNTVRMGCPRLGRRPFLALHSWLLRIATATAIPCLAAQTY
jgi:hypothetical protein